MSCPQVKWLHAKRELDRGEEEEECGNGKRQTCHHKYLIIQAMILSPRLPQNIE
ncbi:hypothetical protein FH972_012400 [Carpinus fangiana]|uniref:Uncharacterized protein n=1 Tax=Carpinus fangiana TaxID=176857 RepID=A0A5N6R3N5_9ROSI|nr:hypothetical protein FH972_012400 [Carpinus fangiana]